MINQETIVALATPNGLGAISVIRISGLNAISITEKLFKPKGNKKTFKSKISYCSSRSSNKKRT